MASSVHDPTVIGVHAPAANRYEEPVPAWIWAPPPKLPDVSIFAGLTLMTASTYCFQSVKCAVTFSEPASGLPTAVSTAIAGAGV